MGFNMSDVKTYFGQGKEFKFDSGDTILSISFSAKDLDGMRANLNEKGYVNLKCGKRKEPSQYGQTHSIYLDTYKPKAKDGVQGKQVSNDDFDSESIPF